MDFLTKISQLFRKISSDKYGVTEDIPLSSQDANPDPAEIRALHVCYLKPGSPNGYEVRVLEETKSLVREGIKVSIAVFVHPDKYTDQNDTTRFRTNIEKITGANVYIFPTTHFFDLDVNESLVKEIDAPLLKIIEQNNIRILHGQALYAAVHVVRIARESKVMTVFDIHGILPEETAMRGGNSDRIHKLETAEALAIRRVDLRVMVSESMNRFYREKYNLPELHHQIVPCCVHPRQFYMEPEKRSLLRKEKAIDDRLVILYLGTLSVWQWPEAMFNLFGKLHKEFPECYFYLLIPETDHGNALALIEKYQIPENYFKLEEVRHEDVGAIIGIADAGILLREIHPVNQVSSPTKFAEYLAAGLPVILTEGIGDYSEMAENLKIGLSVNADSASLSAMDIDEIREFFDEIRKSRVEWGRRCLQTANFELNWKTFGKKLADKYRELTGIVTPVSDDKSYAPVENNNKPVLACVFDTFTYSCFRNEFNILKPTPDNWENVFESGKVKGFFIESAWFGNDETWTNRIGKFNNQSGILLGKITAYCREKGIPTIFWNKEDPVHFNYFIEDAAKFDYIFTTDADMVASYQGKNPAATVLPLPFAAQPLIHNPVREESRNHRICFAGTYYNFRYPERKAEMDFLLRPALDFGLDIYDRNFGTVGEKADHYRFPEIFSHVVKGKLQYPDMVKAYKRYRVFLNVNSVKESPTMFSRRVFELLACGTPVISTYSKGIIDLLGEETVLITESEQDTRKQLERLLEDEQYWWRKSLHGMRTVLLNHTYRHRTMQVFNAAGIPFSEPEPVTFVVVMEIVLADDAFYLLEMMKHQACKDFEVCLVSNVEVPSYQTEIEKTKHLFQSAGIPVSFSELKDITGKINSSKSRQYFAFLNRSDYYGPNYLMDFALAIDYSAAEIIGKKSYFSVSENNRLIELQHKGMDYMYVTDLPGDSLVLRTARLQTIGAGLSLNEMTFSPGNDKYLSIDPYNYLKNGRELFGSSPDKVGELINI